MRFSSSCCCRSPTRPLEQLCEFACGRRSRFSGNSHRVGLDRRRIRQREKSYLHPAATWGAERDSRQARKENLAHPPSARRNTPGIPTTALPASRSDRELFSSLKRKLSARAPGRSLRRQIRQTLLLGLSFNLYRLRLCWRISTSPTVFISFLSVFICGLHFSSN